MSRNWWEQALDPFGHVTGMLDSKIQGALPNWMPNWSRRLVAGEVDPLPSPGGNMMTTYDASRYGGKTPWTSIQEGNRNGLIGGAIAASIFGGEAAYPYLAGGAGGAGGAGSGYAGFGATAPDALSMPDLSAMNFAQGAAPMSTPGVYGTSLGPVDLSGSSALSTPGIMSNLTGNTAAGANWGALAKAGLGALQQSGGQQKEQPPPPMMPPQRGYGQGPTIPQDPTQSMLQSYQQQIQPPIGAMMPAPVPYTMPMNYNTPYASFGAYAR